MSRPHRRLIAPAPSSTLLQDPSFQLETLRHVSRRNLLRFLDRIKDMNNPSIPEEERKLGYSISHERAVASLQDLFDHLLTSHFLALQRRNSKRGLVFWCLLPVIGGALWSFRNHTFDWTWGLVKIFGALGIVGFNEAGTFVRRRAILNVETAILILKERTWVGDNTWETEEEVHWIMARLRGWEWMALTLT